MSPAWADLLKSHHVLRAWVHVTKTFPTIAPNHTTQMMTTMSSENGGFHLVDTPPTKSDDGD